MSISTITDQYLHILKEANAWNMEIASEFMVMAATLLALKSRMLLPAKVEKDLMEAEDSAELDPREELIERLLIYKQFKRLGDQLEVREIDHGKVYSRPPLDFAPYVPKQNPLSGVSPDRLLQIFLTVIDQQEIEQPLTKVAREEISVSERMNQIVQKLLTEPKLWFSSLLQIEYVTREWLITTFLAILELMKTKQVNCHQDELFMDICITLCESRETA